MSKVLVLTIALMLPRLSSATVVPLDVWLQFSFLDVDEPAMGCEPADPDGLFCDASSSGNSSFLEPPPWIFFAPAGLVTQFIITDAFEAGDRFQVFDFGSPIGSTSPAVPESAFCGSDPASCVLNPAMSRAMFDIAAGEQHSITIVPLASPFGAGSAYLRVEVVPEPAGVALTAAGALALAIAAWMRRTS